MSDECPEERARVLFVDDEENVLRSLRRLFIDEPLEVITVSSGREGLDVLKGVEVAVIVSDQRMPGMDGVAFLEGARGLSPDSIRMVLTGYADISAAVGAINHGGAHRYITKPWDDDELLITVKDAVKTFGLIKENRYLAELTAKQNKELQRWSAELEICVQEQTIDLTRQNQELGALNRRLQKNIESVITSLSNLIELRDSSVSNHSGNVAALSVEMAELAGLGDADREAISVAALLHDIGKIGMPDIVLAKQIRELTPDEKAEYLRHPLRGQAAVAAVADLAKPGELIRHHHESFDGKGFPDNLRGKDIPVGSRIIAMADAFDRMSVMGSGTLSVEKSLETLRASINGQFDPALFPCLRDAVHKRARSFAEAEGNPEMELAPRDLVPGLVITRDVRTGTGLLLLGKGVTLTRSHIDAINRCYHLDPSKNGVYVRAGKHAERGQGETVTSMRCRALSEVEKN